MEKELSDFSVILSECGLGRLNSAEVLNNIANLEPDFDEQKLINLYNYIIESVNEPDILIGVIKMSDSHKNTVTLSKLTDKLLLKNTEDNLINVRALCAKAISNYKDTSTVGALLYCLNNKQENYKVRLACADALGRIGDKYAVEPLIDVVKDENEKSVYVKESATFALGLLGDTSAIDPLVAIMESKQGLLDKFSFLKEKIIEALGKLNLNNQKVFKVLKSSLLDSSPIVRINTIEALMNSEYEEAENLIRTALKDEDEEVQKNALTALYNMIGRDILDEVIALPSYSESLKTEAQNMIDEYEVDEDE